MGFIPNKETRYERDIMSIHEYQGKVFGSNYDLDVDR